MNRLLALILSVFVLAFVPATAWAEDLPIRVESGNYGIESMFFGNTGAIYSYSASVPPRILSGPVVSAIATQSATVSWTTDKPGTSIVFIGTSSGTYPNQYGHVSADQLVENHEVRLTNLSKGTKYYLKVRTVDVDGNTVESEEISFTSDRGDLKAPVITMGPSISIDSSSLVTISWETDEIASSQVEYGIKDVAENTIGRADDLTLFHQVRVPGLQPLQHYVWRVKSADAAGNVTYSESEDLSTPNSPFISGFTVTDITLSSAVIQWTTSTSSTTVVDYGTASGTYTTHLEEASSSLSHLVRLSGLQSGTKYYLRVSGTDASGNRLQSDEKIFLTVIIPIITDLVVSDITSDKAVVTWKSTSPIDELLRYEVVENSNPSLKGKKMSGGSDVLSTDHRYEINDLESSSTYSLTIVGKDVFGNQAVSPTVQFVSAPDTTPPEILNMRSDTTIDLGSRQTVQVLVSFELSELGQAVIEYGSGPSGTTDKKVETDTQMSRAKFMVIPGLQPGQTYHYHVVAKDRAGNPATSPDYLVLAPVQPTSLLDLIFGQIRSNFGWMGRL